MPNLKDLHDEIALVCPINGLSGDIKDPSNVEIDFAPTATPEQKIAAQDICNSFDVNMLGSRELDNSLDEALVFAANNNQLDNTKLIEINALVVRGKISKLRSDKQKYFDEINTILSPYRG